MAERVIFHVDANSAFLSWTAAYKVKVLGEELDIRDVPSVVAGDKASRHSIILAKSTPAKKYGIHTGEPLFQALEKCPDLVIVPPDYSLYVEASRHFVEMLRQFEGFSAFSGMEDVLGRLEDHVSAMRHKRRPVILLEKNDNLKGLKFIDPLYKAILAKNPVKIIYKSFKARDMQKFIFSPFFLKEFRNRWFVYGWKKGAGMLYNLALDRIHEMGAAPGETYQENNVIDPDTFFDNLIGVTKNINDKAHRVRFWAAPAQVPYIETKPLHKSQFVVQRNEDGSAIFQMEVVLNYELEKDLLGFGEGVKVLSPRILVHNMSRRLRQAADNYR
jgi:predicted DNA-binding transcriptional regulator YafY